MTFKRSSRWLGQLFALSIAVALSVVGIPGVAQADTVYGAEGPAYSGVSNPPTSDKPQSKLWWNDGSWWADMWATGSGWHIFRLDRSSETWVDTGVPSDSRGNTLADVLWDGTHLYIASHVVAVSSEHTPQPSVSGQPAKLYRYSYTQGTYTLDSGFPTTITNNTSESMTIDQDSNGAIWATWTQVAGDATSGFTNTVYVNYSAPGGTSWSTPFVLPVASPNPAPDDISAVVAFGKNKIGVMWSDQRTGTVWWAWRTDGTSQTASSSWNVQAAIKGNALADDHLNIKQLQSDNSGRVFASVKTSLDTTSTDPTQPQLLLLVFKPGTGAFTSTPIATVGDCVTRPQIVLDTTNNVVHEFHTGPPASASGCPFSGVAGSIYEKTASMDNPVFGAGRGTPVMQEASSGSLNDVTTTKQSVDSTTGIVALASDNVAKVYWFSDRPIVPAPRVPVASFTATPTSGIAPLNVSFTDTSSGPPTSWSWDFGDGGTSTTQNPAHTYSSAGTYTAKLTATNSLGSNSTSSTITVTAGTLAQQMDAKAAAWGLGAATSPVTAIRDGGFYRNYQYGAVISTPTHGLFVSTGPIRDAWAALGYENGVMGYPTSDQVGGLANGGAYQNYQGGTIIWSPASGAHAVRGPIRDEWAALGYENGVMGYPTSDQVGGLANGGAYQNYQGGTIIWSPASGAHAVRGPIRDAWASIGYESSALGYPTSDVYSVTNGTAQNFQGGRITYVNGATRIMYS